MLCVVALGSIAACGGIVQPGGGDAGLYGAGDATGSPVPPSSPTAPPAACPIGGPEGTDPVLVGPPPGDTGDLWRGLADGDGEGESLLVPRAGVIDQVVVQIFADPGVGGCLTRLYRWCEGERVLAASTETPASAFPIYIVVAQPGTNIWDQDLSTTSIAIDPPVAVAAGERVDAVFSATGSTLYTRMLVSVITMDDITPDAYAIFPDGAPGIGESEQPGWDYHAQIRLR